jgi:phosphinothricin acetyltransferase
MTATLTVVDAREEHLAGIEEIYAAAALTSPSTFDLQGHPLTWWRELLAAVDADAGRLLLAAVDGNGEVAGYARSGRFRDKPAYDSTCETSVYVAETARGRGVGSALYGELLSRLDAGPLRLAVGGVTEPNSASTRLHVAHGFERVGTFVGVGTKFGRLWDVTWYQRPLGARYAGARYWPSAPPGTM